MTVREQKPQGSQGSALSSLMRVLDPIGEDTAFRALMEFATTHEQPLSGYGQHKWWRDMAEAVVTALDERGLIATQAEDTMVVPCPWCGRLLIYGDSEDMSVLCECDKRVFLDAYDCHYLVEASDCQHGQVSGG